ncbi:hypothetical protein DUNSADRAFT_18400 [Dunaliella salina]|uniref:Encoded protein n=1 Tax=Dunaliella salina TaxID=3046 RepID=A0ABQ7GZ21_DUNSA|nr:hypothetical protein DUNSADRAFT_18400 [Dunaliella salina]|eukprot:KAF5839857.1 hypothetical protein DUNSADRAFT_18400 [Dunaliella salina]
MEANVPQPDLIAQFFQRAIDTFQPLSREGCSHQQQQDQEPVPAAPQQQQRSHRRSQHSGHSQARATAGAPLHGVAINEAQAPCAIPPEHTLPSATSTNRIHQGGVPVSIQPTPPAHNQTFHDPTKQHVQPHKSGVGLQPVPSCKKATNGQNQQRVHQPCSRALPHRTRRRFPPPPPPPPPPFLPNVNTFFLQQWGQPMWWPLMHANC